MYLHIAQLLQGLAISEMSNTTGRLLEFVFVFSAFFFLAILEI
jgi:hypothetical protein